MGHVAASGEWHARAVLQGLPWYRMLELAWGGGLCLTHGYLHVARSSEFWVSAASVSSPLRSVTWGLAGIRGPVTEVHPHLRSGEYLEVQSVVPGGLGNVASMEPFERFVTSASICLLAWRDAMLWLPANETRELGQAACVGDPPGAPSDLRRLQSLPPALLVVVLALRHFLCLRMRAEHALEERPAMSRARMLCDWGPSRSVCDVLLAQAVLLVCGGKAGREMGTPRCPTPHHLAVVAMYHSVVYQLCDLGMVCQVGNSRQWDCPEPRHMFDGDLYQRLCLADDTMVPGDDSTVRCSVHQCQCKSYSSRCVCVL